jgi:hypothetical protein
MKIKIIFLLTFLIFLSGCYNNINSNDLNQEKLAVNDYNETIKNFDKNMGKVIFISEPVCNSGNSGGVCYINLTLESYEKQIFSGIQYHYFYGSTTAIRFSSERLSKDYLINKSIELEGCDCNIFDLSLICECGNVIYNSTFLKNDNYVSYPSYKANIDNLINQCIKIEFINNDGIAFLKVPDVRDFKWFDIINCE